MKVRYTKTYTDEFGDVFQPGWVAEHTDADGARRIALGVCEEVNPEARAFKYKVDAPLSIEECVTNPEEKQGQPFFSGPKSIATHKQK